MYSQTVVCLHLSECDVQVVSRNFTVLYIIVVCVHAGENRFTRLVRENWNHGGAATRRTNAVAADECRSGRG